MISNKLMLLLVFVLPFLLLIWQAEENFVYSPVIKVESYEDSVMDKNEKYDFLNFLGKEFNEIKQIMGEPDEQGYSSLYGTHYYILYQHKEGFIRFSSPVGAEKKTVISIVLGPGIEVLGVEVGKRFFEIKEILGTPDFGPETGMDDQYYMDYHFGETNQQVPEIYISFSSNSINCPTHNVFIKLESLDYSKMETVQSKNNSSEYTL